MTALEYQLAFSAAVLVPAALLVWAAARGDRERAERSRMEVDNAARLRVMAASLIEAGRRFEIGPLEGRPGAYFLMVHDGTFDELDLPESVEESAPGVNGDRGATEQRSQLSPRQ